MKTIYTLTSHADEFDRIGTTAVVRVLESHTPPRIMLTMRGPNGQTASVEFPIHEAATVRKVIAVEMSRHEVNA